MDNIEDMIGYRPFPVLKYCWMFVTPLICMVRVTGTKVFLVSASFSSFLYFFLSYLSSLWG